jgi:hypothetical protein
MTNYFLINFVIGRGVSVVLYLEDGAWTDHPKSAIFSVLFGPSNKFSGFMSLWITFLEWQYWRAEAN